MSEECLLCNVTCQLQSIWLGLGLRVTGHVSLNLLALYRSLDFLITGALCKLVVYLLTMARDHCRHELVRLAC